MVLFNRVRCENNRSSKCFLWGLCTTVMGGRTRRPHQILLLMPGDDRHFSLDKELSAKKRTKDSFSQMSSWSVNWCSEPKSQESWGLTSSSDALYFYKTQMLNVLKLGPWIHPAEVWNQKCQNFHKKTSQDSVEKCLNQGLMLVMTSVEIWGHDLFEPESVETYLFLALLPVGPGFFF